MFPLPGLGSVDRCQNILCVVNRRLHYARVVWVVNQYACFGRLQGNVEHLKKATGLLSTVGPQKSRACVGEARPEQCSSGNVTQSTCLCAAAVKRGYTWHFLFFVVKLDGHRSQK